MTTIQMEWSPDQARGCRCGEDKGDSAGVAPFKKMAAPALAETPNAEPAVISVSKGCCCGS